MGELEDPFLSSWDICPCPGQESSVVLGIQSINYQSRGQHTLVCLQTIGKRLMRRLGGLEEPWRVREDEGRPRAFGEEGLS